MAYRNHTPGGCCCDACFSVTDNFCDMDFSIPPEITWGDAPSYGWTNYQCYADGHPGPFRYQGMAPRAVPANLPGSVSPKFVGGIYEYDLVIDESATATIIPEIAAADLVAVQIRRTGSNTCQFWLARYLFRFGSDWSWAPLSNAQTFTHSGVGTRMRVRVWIKFPGGTSGAPLAKVFAAADEDLEDFTHLLTFNANKPAVPNALIVSQYPTIGEEWAAATALDVLQTTAPTAPQQYQNARIRHRKFRWQATSDWGGGSGCPTLTENDHVEGFATNIPFPETLRLTVTGCAHAAWNQVFPLTRTALTQPSSRIYETENKNWDNSGNITTAGLDFYHVILRKIEAYIGTIGDLRFRIWCGIVFGPTMPLPTNGTTQIITAQFDIGAPGENVLQDSRSMSAAYHVTGRPQHADDYTQLIFDDLIGQSATFTLALV